LSQSIEIWRKKKSPLKELPNSATSK